MKATFCACPIIKLDETQAKACSHERSAWASNITHADICRAIYLISRALLMTFGIKCADPGDICPKQLPRTQRARECGERIFKCVFILKIQMGRRRRRGVRLHTQGLVWWEHINLCSRRCQRAYKWCVFESAGSSATHTQHSLSAPDYLNSSFSLCIEFASRARETKIDRCALSNSAAAGKSLGAKETFSKTICLILHASVHRNLSTKASNNIYLIKDR